MTKEELLTSLEYDFRVLTSQLKSMDSDDPSYGRTWNERADIRRKITEIEQSNE